MSTMPRRLSALIAGIVAMIAVSLVAMPQAHAATYEYGEYTLTLEDGVLTFPDNAVFENPEPLNEILKAVNVKEIRGKNVTLKGSAHSLFAEVPLSKADDLSTWNVDAVTDMDSMFYWAGSDSLVLDLSSWNLSNVTDVSGMFSGAEFNQLNADGWNLSNVTDVSGMFSGAEFNQLNVNNWTVSSQFNSQTGANSYTGTCESVIYAQNWNLRPALFLTGNYKEFYGGTDIDQHGLPDLPLGVGSWMEMWKYFSPCVKVLDVSNWGMHVETNEGGNSFTYHYNLPNLEVVNISGNDFPKSSVQFPNFNLDSSERLRSITVGAVPTSVGISQDLTSIKWRNADAGVTVTGSEMLERLSKGEGGTWERPVYTVRFKGNTGSGYTDEVDGLLGEDVTLSSNGFTKLGYVFTGWNTAEDGSGEAYAENAPFAIPEHNVTLYAQWKRLEYVYDGFVAENTDGDKVDKKITSATGRDTSNNYLGDVVTIDLGEFECQSETDAHCVVRTSDGFVVRDDETGNKPVRVITQTQDTDGDTLIDVITVTGIEYTPSDPQDGEDGVSITNIVFNGDGTMTITLSNGDTYTSPDLRGDKGDAGADGKDGVDGVSITNVLFNENSSITVEFSDGNKYTSAPLKGDKGDAGADGKDGVDGVGIVDVIINDDFSVTLKLSDGKEFTTPPLKGADGDNGKDGKDGKDGVGVVDIIFNDDSSVTYMLSNGQEFTSDPLKGADGKDGIEGNDGKDGIGVASVVFNDDYTLTVTLTDGTYTKTPPLKGDKGDKGDPGADGENGIDGVGVATVIFNPDSTLTITLTNGNQITTAPLKGADGENGIDGVGVASVFFNADSSLTVMLTDGTTVKSDSLKGADGKTGVGVQKVIYNDDTSITIILTDGTTSTTGPLKGADGKDGNGAGIIFKDVIGNDDGSVTITMEDTTNDGKKRGRLLVTLTGYVGDELVFTEPDKVAGYVKRTKLSDPTVGKAWLASVHYQSEKTGLYTFDVQYDMPASSQYTDYVVTYQALILDKNQCTSCNGGTGGLQAQTVESSTSTGLKRATLSNTGAATGIALSVMVALIGAGYVFARKGRHQENMVE